MKKYENLVIKVVIPSDDSEEIIRTSPIDNEFSFGNLFNRKDTTSDT